MSLAIFDLDNTLIAGDSDFVPAAKFARKEGVDFILDPMMNHIDPSLHEHIDGLMSIKNMSKKDSRSSKYNRR